MLVCPSCGDLPANMNFPNGVEERLCNCMWTKIHYVGPHGPAYFRMSFTVSLGLTAGFLRGTVRNDILTIATTLDSVSADNVDEDFVERLLCAEVLGS